MKKVLIVFFGLSICLFANASKAQTEDNFFEDVIISDSIKHVDKVNSAKDKASSLLDAAPKVIKIEGEPAEFRSRQKNKSIATQSQKIEPSTEYGEAPFGLYWGATYNQTKVLGVDMQRIEIENIANSFVVENPPKPLKEIENIVVSFGEDNMLLRIMAYTLGFNDDNKATKGLKLYYQYYKLLNQKYGNAKEFYTPKITKIETIQKDANGKEMVVASTKEEPIGSVGFLESIALGEAVLYSTFEDANVGVALTFRVNENGQSYIILDYTNLKIYKELEDITLNSL